MKSIYKRVLIKLSGEALSGGAGHGIDQGVLNNIVDQIINVAKTGVEVGIVVGAGNFWRGRQGTEMDRTAADHMGMLATVLNAIAIKDAIDRRGGNAVVQTALEINRVAENYSHEKAINYLKEGKIVIFACGTGNPYFTTDTGAALKSAEIEADALLLAKNVDGIYDSDPKINKNAKKLDKVTYKEYLNLGLHAMDLTAISFCMENNIPVLAFGLFEENALLRAVSGEKFGTLIQD